MDRPPMLQPSCGRRPGAGEAEGRYGGGSAAGGHPHFLRGPLMLIPIRRRRCLSKAHRTQPPRIPDARSCDASERERAGAFPPRPCEGMVHGIAHQVKPEWWVAGRFGRRWGSLKKCGWPPAALPSVCRSRRPQGSLVRPATADVRGHRVARGELATGSGDARRVIRSAMNLENLVLCLYRIRKKNTDTNPANGVIPRKAPPGPLQDHQCLCADRRICPMGAPSCRLRWVWREEPRPFPKKILRSAPWP